MMRKSVILGALAAVVTGPALAADLGIAINIAQPGFFGQLEIGAVPPPPAPALIFPQPVVAVRDRGYDGGPIYLRVPPGYERHWAHHCAEYNACGRPVYFVRDEWYQHEYVPRYQENRRLEEVRRGPPREERREERPEEWRGDERNHDDKGRDHDRDHDRD